MLSLSACFAERERVFLEEIMFIVLMTSSLAEQRLLTGRETPVLYGGYRVARDGWRAVRSALRGEIGRVAAAHKTALLAIRKVFPLPS